MNIETLIGLERHPSKGHIKVMSPEVYALSKLPIVPIFNFVKAHRIERQNSSFKFLGFNEQGKMRFGFRNTSELAQQKNFLSQAS